MYAVDSASPVRKSRSRGRRLGAALAAIGVAVGLGGATAASVAPTPAAASAPQILGTGSSFAAPAIEQWQSDASAFGLNINYQSSSSVNGLNEFAQSLVDFGASEIGYSTQQASSVPTEPYQYMPDVAGGISFAFNLTDANGQKITTLRLSAPTLLKIWTDQITTWNNAAILADNPGVALPNTPIKVVYRSDPAGESYILSYYFDYLYPTQWSQFATAMKGTSASTLCPDCNAFYPHYDASNGAEPPGYNFNNWVGQNGSDAAAGYVAAAGDDGAITYVETAWAKLYNLPTAAIQDFAGGYSEPTSVNVAVALTKAVLYPDLEQDLRGVFTNPAAGAYPLSSYSYLITAEKTVSPAKGAELSQFIYFLACGGQSQMAALGYSPIPPNLVADDLAAGERINGATSAPPMNAASCKNPYIDGQTPLVGEPTVIATGPSPGDNGNGPGPSAAAANGGGGSGTNSGAGASGSMATGTSPSSTGAGGQTAKASVAGRSARSSGRSAVYGRVTTTGAPSSALGAGSASATISLDTAVLATDAARLRSALGGSTMTMVVSTVGLLALLAVPPLIVVRRRRVTSSHQATAGEATGRTG